MSKGFISAFILWCALGGAAFAAIPNLASKLKEEKESLVSVQEINGTEIIQFATDDPFFVIKVKIHRLLGKEWKEVSPEKSKKNKGGAFKAGKGDKAPKSLGSARFENDAHKSVFVHLTLIERPSKGKKYTATVSKVNLR